MPVRTVPSNNIRVRTFWIKVRRRFAGTRVTEDQKKDTFIYIFIKCDGKKRGKKKVLPDPFR